MSPEASEIANADPLDEGDERPGAQRRWHVAACYDPPVTGVRHVTHDISPTRIVLIDWPHVW